jgi:hypothetical protein
MAQQVLNIGSAPDDGTGDPLRSAYHKANLNFTELYQLVGLRATTQALNEEAAARLAADNLRALLTQIVRTDAAQVLTTAQKLQAAVNGGTLVTIPFQLIAPTVNIASGTWQLPPLPANFHLHSVHLTIRSASASTLNFAFTMEGANVITPLAGYQQADTDSGASIPTTVIAPGIVAGKQLTANLSVFTPLYGGDDSTGLCLWLRGVWA